MYGEKNYTELMNVYLNEPPDIFEYGKPNWREKHEDVLMYAKALFASLAQDRTLSNWQKTATLKAAFYRGSEDSEQEELAIRSVNLCKVAIDLKVSKLIGDRLKLHAFAGRSQDIRKATVYSRWFDWHEQITGRRLLQNKIEKITPIWGLSGVVAIPRWLEPQKILVPAYGERLSPQNMFFDPKEEEIEDMTCFIIREVQKGYLLDQKYNDILAKHYPKSDERHFARNQIFTGLFTTLYDNPMNKMLSVMGTSDVEILRIWVKDNTTEKISVWHVDTPEAEEARTQADDELLKYDSPGQLEDILNDGILPKTGENHYNHRVRHQEHWDNLQQERDAGMPVPQTYFDNLELHIAATEAMMKEQPPDERAEVLKFNGGWRYIKVIGDIIVQDGGSPFDYQPVPVALFRNNLDPESTIGISDLDAIMNINRDLNALISDKIEHSFKEAFPKEFRPRTLDGEVANADGIIFVDDLAEIQMCQYLTPPPSSSDAEKMIGYLMKFMEVIGGVNSTNLGMVPETRTSGIGTQMLQNAAARPYIATEELLNHGWQQIAKIGIAQMRQFFDEEVIGKVGGQEYQEEIQAMRSEIDPYANLFIERVPRDTDFMRQRSNEEIMLTQLAMALKIPPQNILKRLGNATDTGATGEYFASINMDIQEDQQAQQQMQAQYEGELPQQKSPLSSKV